MKIRMGLSYYLERALLDAILLGFRFATPAALYVALFHTNPGKEARGDEVAKAGYERVLATFGRNPGGVYVNAKDIQFREASEDWGWVSHLAVFDAVKGGNMLFFGEVDPEAEIVAGDVPTFAVGALEVLWNPVGVAA